MIKIDQKWTLFLDRDGVINKKLPGDYVNNWERFEFLPGVFEGLSLLKSIFGKIIVVTNQQGIGKGFMTTEDLTLIHERMLNRIKEKGGKIDKIYFCPDLETSDSKNRKPAIGMAIQAKKDFPEINFSQSIVIGDSLSDMQFAKNIGAISVLVNNTSDNNQCNKHLINFVFNDLYDFSTYIYEKRRL